MRDEKTLNLCGLRHPRFTGPGCRAGLSVTPVTFIVPYGAGGAVAHGAHALIEADAQLLGQPIVIENVTGANGTIGVGRAVRAAPDSYAVASATGHRTSPTARSTT